MFRFFSYKWTLTKAESIFCWLKCCHRISVLKSFWFFSKMIHLSRQRLTKWMLGLHQSYKMNILGTNANENKKSFMPKAIFDFATMGEILMIQFSGAIFVYLPIFLSNFCDQIMSIKAISLTWKRRSTKQRIFTPPVDLNQGEFFFISQWIQQLFL